MKKMMKSEIFLFIGNSLTYYNDLPGILDNLALHSNKDLIVDQVTIPGASLVALLNNQNVINKIHEKKLGTISYYNQMILRHFPICMIMS